MGLGSITGAKTLAAAVAGATLFTPLAGSASAFTPSKTQGTHVKTTQGISGSAQLGAAPISTVKEAKVKTAQAPSLFAAKGKTAASATYGKFAKDMSKSPLSSSNTTGVFGSFKGISEETAQNWAQNGIPENADVVSRNYNAGTPEYNPKYLPVMQQNGNYLQVNVNDEQEAQLRENIIRTAESKAGLPYIWGGNNPNVGLDCSGLTKYVYGKNGITLPRVAYQQRGAVKAISQADVKPGDLVFVNGTTHVGIVLDPAKKTYWHAPRPGSYVQVGTWNWGSNISFGTVINNTEHPVNGISTKDVLSRVNNYDATTTVQVGDRSNPTIKEDLKKNNTAPKKKVVVKSTASKGGNVTKPKKTVNTVKPQAPKPSSTPSTTPSKPKVTPSSSSTPSAPKPTATAKPSASASSTAAPTASSTASAKPKVVASATASPTPSSLRAAATSTAAATPTE